MYTKSVDPAVHAAASIRFNEAHTRFIEARIEWLPLLVVEGAVILSWRVNYLASSNPFPWIAVYLSALAGALSGKLTLCRLCNVRLFLRRHSWETKCQFCDGVIRGAFRRADVHRTLDRLRKRPDGKGEHDRAMMEIRHGMPIAKWLTLHDHRRGPQGRKLRQSRPRH
jgi:hypothetical protein